MQQLCRNRGDRDRHILDILLALLGRYDYVGNDAGFDTLLRLHRGGQRCDNCQCQYPIAGLIVCHGNPRLRRSIRYMQPVQTPANACHTAEMPVWQCLVSLLFIEDYRARRVQTLVHALFDRRDSRPIVQAQTTAKATGSDLSRSVRLVPRFRWRAHLVPRRHPNQVLEIATARVKTVEAKLLIGVALQSGSHPRLQHGADSF